MVISTGKVNGFARIVDTFTTGLNVQECTLKNKVLDSVVLNALVLVVAMQRRWVTESVPRLMEVTPQFLSLVLVEYSQRSSLESGQSTICNEDERPGPAGPVCPL
mmetsp:Transcript_29857/g.68898  ORF Transcript_29857/g.68898 Transcript_29857/m.68898 type:complete len:105 (-) Transcript_29857:1426-1740(-)